MFNFFKKKKKNSTSVDKKTEMQPKAYSGDSELAKSYATLLEKYKNVDQASLTSKVKQLIEIEDYSDPNIWMEAFAICDASIDNNLAEDSIKELYRQIYSRNWNKHASMKLDDQDYSYWFQLNESVHRKFIEQGHNRGWCELADLYNSARRTYRDMNKVKEFLLEGVKVDDPASLGDYGYGLYMGIPGYTDQADREEGLRLIKRSQELGYESAGILLLYIDFYTEEDQSKLLNQINKFIEDTPQPARKPYHLLADYYFRTGTDNDKATDAMLKGVESKHPYSKYLLGMSYLNGRIEGADKQEGIQLLEDAYDYYVAYAANFLGQYYNFANDENSSVEKAIEWHEKAALYYQTESLFELAIIYLYNDQVKDIEKGLNYLEQAVQEGSHRALSEKAYLMLETDILPNDNLLAKSLLEQSLEMGNDYAPYRLGLGYQNAEFEEKPDYVKALEYFELGAVREHLYSLELAGNYYRVGVGGDSEEAQQKAIDYLNRAIQRGSAYGQVELALCYEIGYGVEKDYQKAFDLYKEAANNNYPYANTKVAAYYEDGTLGEPNYPEALEQYKIAAEAGMPDAIYHLGRYNKYAVGIPENPDEAMRLFQQAAEAGSAPGLVELALAYEQEYGGTEFDAAKALEYMTKAAEMDYTYAQHKLGTYYYYGLLETDYNKALEYFTKAYNQGYPWSALMLGDYYLYNVGGGEPEYDKAFNYYKYAEEQGVVSEGIGICYEYGLGAEENETEAFKYYTLASNDGYTAAKYRLGACYKYGKGTTESLSDAYRWFAEAAEEGNYNAQHETAMMLLNGEGTGADLSKGIEILTKVAEADHDEAQFELGNCYLTGKGVAEDEALAMYWYQKAADNGNEQAQKITGKRERRKR